MKETNYQFLLLDRIALEVDGQVVAINNLKARALLAFLLLSSSREVRRETLCALLWPDSDGQRSRASLRQTLKRLKKDLGAFATILDSRSESLKICEKNLKTDHEQLLTRISQGKEHSTLPQDIQAVHTYLSGIDGLTFPLDSWLAVQRRIFLEEVSSCLNDALAGVPVTDPHHLSLARALSVIEPGNESACRAECRALYCQGNPAGAVAAYERLVCHLDEEFDTEPESETIKLIAEIKLGTLQIPDQTFTGKGSGRRPTLCIQEPTARKDTPVGTHFLMFRRDLVDILVRFREWRIVDRPAENSKQDVYLLDLEEMKGQGDPEVRAMLKHAATGQLIWSERIVLTRDSWEANSLRLIRKFAVAISTNLSTAQLRSTPRLVPHEGTVFERWLRCQEMLSRWAPIHETEALNILESIVIEDPEFAPAHAEIASICNSQHLVYPGTKRSNELDEKAMKHASVALKLDPLDTRSQRVTAWAHLMQRRYDLALIHFEQALDLNSSSSFTLMSCAQGIAFCGDADRAELLSQAAADIEPTQRGFLEGYLVGIHFLGGRFEDAVRTAELCGHTISNLLGWKAAALWELERFEEAHYAANTFVEVITEAWCGDVPATRSAIQTWFSNSFPIRNRTMHHCLNKGLFAAMEPQRFICTG